ncbi:MAG: LysM peptidoglycan-binding domain-containing protein, partial [Oscillospiraceae bacterium]
GERCNHRCRCSEDQAVPTVGGIEVRYSLLFSYQMIAKEQITVVTGAEPGEFAAREGEQPSLILRVMQGERLWDLAKGYRTTVAEIMAVNALEQPEAPTGTLLLIPQKR